MRKVRDYDSELKVLEDRARALKARRVEQLGGLVVSTGADTLDLETLAGALLEAVTCNDANTKEAWRVKGAIFFQRRGRKPIPGDVLGGPRKAAGHSDSAATQPGADAASGGGTASD